MDDAVEDLRARVRRGDEAARPALQRAVVRAGRSIELAWEGLPLRLGVVLESLAPTERATVDADLASIDPRRVVDLLEHVDGAVLVTYAPDRHLVIVRGPVHAPGIVDLRSRTSGHVDLTDARGRWHVDWEEVEREAVVPLAPYRALDAARALFEQLGLAFDDPGVEQVGPERPPDVPYEAWTTWSSGVRRVRVLERWDELVPLERREHTTHVEVTGLPGGARLWLDQADPGYALRRYRIEARGGRAPQLEEAWLRGLEVLARREASPGPWTPLLPEAWQARADALPLDPRALTRVETGDDQPVLGLLAGPPCEGVRWAVRILGRLDGPSGPAALTIEPAGPLPEDLSITPLRLSRRAAAPGPPVLALVFEAITGTALPACPEIERTDSDLRPARPRRRYRAGSWVALAEGVPHRARVVSAARVHHEGGELAALVWSAAMTPTAPAASELTLWLIGAPRRAAPIRERVRERLVADGWGEVST